MLVIRVARLLAYSMRRIAIKRQATSEVVQHEVITSDE